MRESHQLAEGDDKTTVTPKREVKYGSNEAWLWEDCAIVPDVLSLGQMSVRKQYAANSHTSTDLWFAFHYTSS